MVEVHRLRLHVITQHTDCCWVSTIYRKDKVVLNAWHQHTYLVAVGIGHVVVLRLRHGHVPVNHLEVLGSPGGLINRVDLLCPNRLAVGIQ